MLNIFLFLERQFFVSNNNKVICIINVIMVFLVLFVKNMYKRGFLKVGELILQNKLEKIDKKNILKIDKVLYSQRYILCLLLLLLRVYEYIL